MAEGTCACRKRSSVRRVGDDRLALAMGVSVGDAICGSAYGLAWPASPA